LENSYTRKQESANGTISFRSSGKKSNKKSSKTPLAEGHFSGNADGRISGDRVFKVQFAGGSVAY